MGIYLTNNEYTHSNSKNTETLELLCETSINDKKYKFYKILEVESHKFILKGCQAKTLAERFNAFYPSIEREELEKIILADAYFFSVEKWKNIYRMKDDSYLIWIEHFDEWGYHYSVFDNTSKLIPKNELL